VTCNTGRFVRNANSGEPGIIAGLMITKNTRNLIQAISIEGSVAERYFDVASDVPRNMLDNRSNAIPRSGRSARAGATLAGFSLPESSSGNGKGALSSFKAAAGRVTV
jgi:hypothetical protein